MKATFVHLSGSKRGETEVFQRERLQIGSHPESELTLQGGPVAPFHAEIRFENCEYLLRDLGTPDGTFVNGGQISEIILQDGDLIEFGVGGHKLRFRTRPEDHLGWLPPALAIGDGRYAALLGVNFYGLLLCTGLFLLPWVYARATQAQHARLTALKEIQQ